MKPLNKMVCGIALASIVAVVALSTPDTPSEVDEKDLQLPAVPADITFKHTGSAGDKVPTLDVSVWRAAGDKPCLVSLRSPTGLDLSEAVSRRGLLTSASLGAPVAEACLNRPVYLAEIEALADVEPAFWHEPTAAPDQGALLGVASHAVRVRELRPGGAVLEFSAGEPREASLFGPL